MKRLALSLSCLLALVALWAVPPSTRAAGRPAALSGTLTVFDFGNFGSAPQTTAVVSTYEHMHPGVVIKLVPLPPGDPCVYEENLLAAGSAPDIVVPCYTQQVFSDLPKHYWLNLTPYLKRPNHYASSYTHWMDLFEPAANQQNAFEGSTYYVMSWSALDVSFFYNKDLFTKVGITQTPTTWAQLMSDSARLQKAGYIPQAFPLGDTYPSAENGSIASWFENQVMSTTFTRLDTNHDGVVDIKELVHGIKHHIYSPLHADYQEAWRLLKQWAQTWEPNAAGVKPAQPGSPSPLQAFLQGKAAMQWGCGCVAAGLRQDKVPFHWGVFPTPPVTRATSSFASAPPPGTGIWGAWNASSFAIPTSTQARGHLALALDFLQWISIPRNEIPATLANGLLPIDRTYHAQDPFNAVFDTLIKHPSRQYATEATLGPEWLTKRIATQQSYLTGQESLQQAMADMQRYTDQAAARMVTVYHLSD